MKLVISVSCGDGYTWWATDHVPIEYESPEAFLVDFDTWKESPEYASAFFNGGFQGTGLDKDTDDFEVWTLEEWFDYYRPRNNK